MKLICLQENLKNYLNTLERISSKNINLPIISNILLEAKENILKLTSTDLELALEIQINCKIENEGKITVPAKLLADFINNLPNKKIEFELKEKNLKISCENFNGIIKSQNWEEFPLIPKINKEKSNELDFEYFKKGLLKIINIVPLSNIRQELLGILIKPEVENFKLVATDSSRLGEVSFNKKINLKETFILPLKTAQELIRIFDKEKTINFSLNQNQIIFFSEKINFISRLIDGDFPNYQSIIPKNFKTYFYSSKNNLIQLIKTISLFSSKGGEMIFDIKENLLSISSNSGEKGEGSSSLPIKLQGDPISLVLNYKFLLDGLNNIEDEEIFFGFNDSSSPAVLKSKNETDYIYIIMPIRM